ncbi:unnamed protein product [Effrenium voratum]|nr:unnamed protein product [Effrenium voratum]
MESREKTVLTLIYPRRPSANLVLLGLKKRGFGEGKLNGFGGKLEPNESLEESAVRELREECGLSSKCADLTWRGRLTYLYDTKPKAMEVNVFDLETWQGEVQETEEMKPAWFRHRDIPLRSMWADDEHWLLQYLDGHLATPFVGRFRFKGHEGPDSWDIREHYVASLCPASVPRMSESLPGSAMVVSTVSFINSPSARPLESFIRYHLAKGFARVMIFVDSPEDRATLDVVRRFPAARVLSKIRGPELLEEQRQACPSYGKLCDFQSEVSGRQLLDAELAMDLAPGLGCRWLVCLDSDELFCTEKPSVVPHFEELEEKDVYQMSYLNHEGVPEQMDTVDYFATVTLFKKHQFAVPLTAPARGALRFWMSRSQRGHFFLFYDNGKSACRTGCGAVPLSQHLWRLPSGYQSCTALADPRNMDVHGFRECADPCVLHFPICGVKWFTAKYKTLGSFPDKWLGRVPLSESFHTDARSLACGPSAETRLEEAFKQEVLLEDAMEATRQVDCGACTRSSSHAQLLDAVQSAADGIADGPNKEATKKTASHEVLDHETLVGIEKGWVLSKAMGYL